MVEIERMNALLVTLGRPRADLKPGLMDAGIAIKNMTLVASLSKPAGFVDPNNPGEIAKGPAKKEGDESEDAKEKKCLPLKAVLVSALPFLVSNTDMAFSGNTLVAGSYHSFNVYDLQEDGIPQLVSSVVCPGGQGDVSIVGDLTIMSAQETRGRLDCGLQGISEDDERFRGLRIFDISDQAPVQVGAVQTCQWLSHPLRGVGSR